MFAPRGIGRTSSIDDLSLTFVDNDWMEGKLSDELVVPVNVRRRKFSITCIPGEAHQEKKVIAELVRRFLETLRGKDIIALAGKDLETGVGSRVFKITKVEELLPSPDQHGVVTPPSNSGNQYPMLFNVGEAEQSLQERIGITVSPNFARTEKKYLQRLQQSIREAESSLRGVCLGARIGGAEKLTEIRRKLASSLFRKSIRTKIATLIEASGDLRSFDDIVTIFGYNRLFTRSKASIGTDIDFMLIIDTIDEALVYKIRTLIKESISPELTKVGVVIEIEDHLILSLASHQEQLNNTRYSLFMLANMFNTLKEKDNAVFITGSERMLREKVLHFSNKQLAHHYCALITNYKGDLQKAQQDLEERLGTSDPTFRNSIIDQLQKMANSELYIGTKPNAKKETIQTVMSTPNLAQDRSTRVRPFSIKYCINRIGDLINATTINTSQRHPQLSVDQLEAIESLGTVLSNIVCYQASFDRALTTIHEHYMNISLYQIGKMTFVDRSVVSDLMSKLGINLNPYDSHFPEACYDGLWALADNMLEYAKKLEESIYSEALAYLN